MTNSNDKKYVILIQGQRSDEFLPYLITLQNKSKDSIIEIITTTQWQINAQWKKINIPQDYNKSYESEFIYANKTDIQKSLREILLLNPMVTIFVVVPYTNKQLYEVLQPYILTNEIICTAPLATIWLKNPQQALELQQMFESKELFRTMMEECWLQDYVLPNKKLWDLDTYEWLCKLLSCEIWRPIFLTQSDEITAWWSGISSISSQQEFLEYKNQNEWKNILVSPAVWASTNKNEYIPTYSANWRFVCFPNPNDQSEPKIIIWDLTKKPTWYASRAFEPLNTAKYNFPNFSAIWDQYNAQWSDIYMDQYQKILFKYVAFLYQKIYDETWLYLPIMWWLDFVIDEVNKKLVATELNLRKQWPDYFLPFFSDYPVDKLWFEYIIAKDDEERKKLLKNFQLSPATSWWYLKLRAPAWKEWLNILQNKDPQNIDKLEWFWLFENWSLCQEFWCNEYINAKNLLEQWYIYFVPPKMLSTQEWWKYIQWSYIVWCGDWFDTQKPTLTSKWFTCLEAFMEIVQNS